MGDIDLEPMRMVQEVEGPRPAKKKMRSNITVGMFDGGIIEDHVLLKGYAKENDVVNTTATSNSLQHGNSVCGAILHGHLGGKTPSDELKNPSVFVESFRVLPAETQITSTRDAESVHGMYETIDQIEAVVAERKDIKLYNLSFGPKEPILDDNISRFTYALDRLTYNVEEGEINPLFCTAVGNDGNRGEYLNRIQTPSDFFTKQIQKLKNDNRRGTARNYSKTLKSLKAFMKNTDSTFNIVTEQFVESYNTFLIQRGVVRNTISFYMRIFRSVYNKAVTQKIIEQTFPFKNVYTGVDRTRKRAVTETVISQLLSIDLKKSKALQFARDLFIFSFYARGMAFVDIVYLKKSNIQNGYITYVRHKTGQELTIRIETRLQNIINRYEKKDSPYVFPILNTEDGNKAYSQYEIALNYYNRQLKRLSKLLEPNINLSSYTPRHTWATTARNKNVPLSIISAGMGHSSEKTTLIYLTKIDNSIIDEVNKAIIDSIKQ